MTDSRWNLGIVATLLLAAAGCGGSSHSATEPSGNEASDIAEAAPPGDVEKVGAGEDEDESTTDLAEHHRHHHHGGFAMFIAMSLDSVTDSPEQAAAITKIRTDMLAAMAPAHDAEKAVLLALANGIAANKIEQSKIDAAVGELSATAANVHDAVAGALSTLHATLTPPQRAALVEKVEAHFEVWHHTNATAESPTREAHKGRLGKLANDLALTPQQVETIRASLAASSSGAAHFDRAEADTHVKAFGEAFASDTFDPKALSMGGALNAHMATWGIQRTVQFYEAVLPVLTPEQRATLADSIRRHANYRHNEVAS